MMSSHFRGLRGLLIALVVLGLVVGAVAVAAHDGGTGLGNASEHAGKDVPANGQDADEPDEDAAEEETDADADENAAGGGDHCATDPRELDEEALAELNHGAIVCWAAHQWAAQQDTTGGYDNHGAWVSEWAKKNGAETSEAGHGKPDDAGKPDGVGKP